jgi:predicted acetyltransferase
VALFSTIKISTGGLLLEYQKHVATVPHARGRGLDAILTCAPLIEARTLGYRVGVLQSSEMGYNIYRRLGFQKLCDMDHFYRATDLDLEP